MKKTLAILLSALLLIGILAGCGGGKTESAPAQTGADTRKDFVFGDYVGSVDPASGA